MRIATYNVEWFTNLFDDEGTLLDDSEWSARHNVTRAEQLAALGIVFTALDADAVMIIEAPDSHRRRHGVRALENFAAAVGIRARQAVMGFVNDTQQEIALIYDPDEMTVAHDPRGHPRFDEAYRIDLDVDAEPEKVMWSKPPLELAVEAARGTRLRMIGVHAKSKAPYGARKPEQLMRIAIENRRKQLAQCIWLRERVEEHLDAGEALMVMGDFNDDPWDRSMTEYALSTHSRNKVTSARSPRLLNLMFPIAGQALGSHYYDNFPGLLDQFLVSRGVARTSGEIRALRDTIEVVRFGYDPDWAP